MEHQTCLTDMLLSCLQEQSDAIAYCQGQRQARLLRLGLEAFVSNKQQQLAKRQAAGQAAELRRRLLLKTVMAAWRSHMQVAKYANDNCSVLLVFLVCCM